MPETKAKPVSKKEKGGERSGEERRSSLLRWGRLSGQESLEKGTGKERRQKVEINYRFLAEAQCGIAWWKRQKFQSFAELDAKEKGAAANLY